MNFTGLFFEIVFTYFLAETGGVYQMGEVIIEEEVPELKVLQKEDKAE